uniref:Uncharacterized protein n=1 Tax=Cucumis melo TaxID=3656 RepID=A0A9I9EB45_CUCME
MSSGREELNRAYRPRIWPKTVSDKTNFEIFSITMIYEIFINYMTEILSLRLEITMCTLVSLGLLVKSSRQIHVQKSVVRWLHASFRSKSYNPVLSLKNNGSTLVVVSGCVREEISRIEKFQRNEFSLTLISFNYGQAGSIGIIRRR